MAYDLRSLSDDDFEAEYHRRLAGKSPSDAAKSIAKSAYAAVPGNEDTNPSQTQTTKQPDYQLPTQPSVNTAQFIGQGGQIETRPYEPLAPTPVYGRGGQITGLLPTIDARAPVKYGGALTGNSLGSEDQFRAKFAPSPDLAALTAQSQANAVSKVNVFDPVKNLQQVRSDNADYLQMQGTGAFRQSVPNPGGGIRNTDLVRPPAADTQQNFYDKQKKKDEYGSYA